MTAVEAMGLKTTLFGQVTTPQLHWLVEQSLRDPEDKYEYVKNWNMRFEHFVSICESEKDFKPR
jgi:hypothetical protein